MIRKTAFAMILAALLLACGCSGSSSGDGSSSQEGLAGFFEGIGWKTESNASTDPKFATIEEAERFFTGKIDEGTPVMVEWEDWGGHWQAVIGIDTCKKFSAYDDVLIMADPYDVTDHYQDGYYVVPLGRFYSMWREGSVTQKAEKYEQPYVAATPAE